MNQPWLGIHEQKHPLVFLPTLGNELLCSRNTPCPSRTHNHNTARNETRGLFPPQFRSRTNPTPANNRLVQFGLNSLRSLWARNPQPQRVFCYTLPPPPPTEPPRTGAGHTCMPQEAEGLLSQPSSLGAPPIYIFEGNRDPPCCQEIKSDFRLMKTQPGLIQPGQTIPSSP